MLELENDVSALLTDCGAAVYSSAAQPCKVSYPYISVRCDRTEDCGFGSLGAIRSADVLVTVHSYRSDDPDGRILQAVLRRVRAVLYRSDLVHVLPRTGMRYYGVVRGASWDNPEIFDCSTTLQLTLKYAEEVSDD